MNRPIVTSNLNLSFRRATGMTLLEVLMAIVIFAVGMLALASLQGNLAKSSGDANMRTVAASIAEEEIEIMRSFQRVETDPDGLVSAYDDIVDGSKTVSRGGIDYAVNIDVTDKYFDVDRETMLDAPPEGSGITDSSIKLVEMTVTWNTDAVFQIDDTNSAGLDSGSISFAAIINSIPSLNNAKVAAEDDGSPGTPPVDYTPGENPDIVALKLHDGGDGPSKFKESTSPQPDVIRSDNVETWFDVVTYSQDPNDAGAVFLRREEFLAVSCQCEFSGTTGPARLPTLWDGYQYVEGAIETKTYGVVPNGVQQSQYCDICCRDHHDGAATTGDSNYQEKIYNSLTAVSGSNHPHYERDRRGNIEEPAVTSGEYIEACRLVRKDGFLRVTKDAVQRGLNGFPEEYLTFDDNIVDYSEYVIEAATDYYENGQDAGDFVQPEDMSPPYRIPASTSNTATALPTVYLATTQQLRSRGIYTDYLTAAATSNLLNCFDNYLANNPTPTPNDPDCLVPGVSSPAEIYPFFDLQLTWLARWTELSTAIDVTNEALETYNAHSRGFASLEPSGGGVSEVTITSHPGNLGLTATGAIDPSYEDSLATQPLFVEANGVNTPVPTGGSIIEGSLTVDAAVRNLDAADLVLEAEQALCGQTDAAYQCLVNGAGGTLTVTGYTRNQKSRWVCSDLTTLSDIGFEDGGTSSTTFSLPNASTTANIWVSNSDCSN